MSPLSPDPPLVTILVTFLFSFVLSAGLFLLSSSRSSPSVPTPPPLTLSPAAQSPPAGAATSPVTTVIHFPHRVDSVTLVAPRSAPVSTLKVKLEPYLGLPPSHSLLILRLNGLALSSFAPLEAYARPGEPLQLALHPRSWGPAVHAAAPEASQSLEGDEDEEGALSGSEDDEEWTAGLETFAHVHSTAREPELVLNFDHEEQLRTDPDFYPSVTQAFGTALLKHGMEDATELASDPRKTAEMRAKCDRLSQQMAFFERKRKFIAMVATLVLPPSTPQAQDEPFVDRIREAATDMVKAADLSRHETLFDLCDFMLEAVEFWVGRSGGLSGLEALLKSESALPNPERHRPTLRGSITALATMLRQRRRRRQEAAAQAVISTREPSPVREAPPPKSAPGETEMPHTDPDTLRRVVVVLLVVVSGGNWQRKAKLLLRHWKRRLGSVPFAERVLQGVQDGDAVGLETILRARIHSR